MNGTGRTRREVETDSASLGLAWGIPLLESGILPAA